MHWYETVRSLQCKILELWLLKTGFMSYAALRLRFFGVVQRQGTQQRSDIGLSPTVFGRYPDKHIMSGQDFRLHPSISTPRVYSAYNRLRSSLSRSALHCIKWHVLVSCIVHFSSVCLRASPSLCTRIRGHSESCTTACTW